MRTLAPTLPVKREKSSVLREDLRGKHTPEILLRRAIVGSSLVGMACMAVTTLFQMGMIKHLADPPLA
jgi:hypothetical protein